MKLLVTLIAHAAFLSGHPIDPATEGIELTRTGKMRIGVEGDTLFMTASGVCKEHLLLWYPATEVTDTASRDLNGPPGHCGFVSGNTGISDSSSRCPLKLEEDGTMEIIAQKLPSDCEIVLKNAFWPSSDENENGARFPYVAVFVPGGIVLLLIGLALLGYFVAWPCWKRRRATARASQAPAVPTPEPLKPAKPNSSVPASVSSVVPQTSTTTLAQSDAPEAKSKTPAMKAPIVKPAKKTSAPPTLTTPASAQSVGDGPEKKTSAVKSTAPTSAAPTQSDSVVDLPEKKKVDAKISVVETPVAPTPSPKTAVAPSPTPMTPPITAKADAVEQKAPTTMEETLEDAPKKEAGPRRPPGKDDKKGHLSADRIFERFEDVRARGSKLTLPLATAPSNPMEEKRKVIETAVESLVRHGIVDQYKEQDMILSRSARGTEPREFLRMQRWYNDGVVRKVDEREKRLLVSLVSAQFKLMEELRSEAEWRLAIVGADFPVDGSRATYTQRTRDYSMKPSTPAFVQMFALVGEYGCDLSLQGDVDLSALFSEYSVQLLFCIALHRHFPKSTRRKALAHISRKIRSLLATYCLEEFTLMPYPLRLLPEALKENPGFFDQNAQVKTDSGREVKQPRKKRCRKKAPKPANAVRKNQKSGEDDNKAGACPKPRSSASKEEGKKSTSKTSAERSRASAESKQE